MDNELFLLLVARKLSGEASEQDLTQLERFFAEDDLCKEKFDLLKLHWENKNRFSTDMDGALQKIMLQVENEENERIHFMQAKNGKPRVIKFPLKFSKVAAISLVCIAGAWFIYSKTTKPSLTAVAPEMNHWQIKEIPKGAKSTIVFADGTKVILNSDSRLKFPSKFSDTIREVYLTGEAFFNVAHNTNVPFIIHTDKMNIKVLGTEFNVKSYPADSTAETTLIHGLIEVTLQDRPSDKIILRPKEKLIVSNSSTGKKSSDVVIDTLSHAAELLITNLHYISVSDSAVAETSWIDNKLVFQDESFANLAAEMSRKYDIDFQFTKAEVKDYRFTGVFEKETINEALKALQLTEKFNYKRVGNTITIY